MQCGDTLLIPAPGMGVTPHLWILAMDPVTDTQLCIIVNVTTLRNSRDQTVVLRKGEHPFVTHDSAVFYGDAQIVDVRQLHADVAARTAQTRERCSPEVIRLVRDGLTASPFTPKKVLIFFKEFGR
jgi:hypothetical protein